MASVTRHSAARQQSAGAAAQVVLLAAVAAGPGLGPLGWLAGLAYALGFWVLLTGAVRRAGADTLGPAGLVTLARALLVGCVTALVADGLAAGVTPVPALVVPALVDPALVVLASVALALDAVDGRVARRTGTATPLGARFDMEVDAFLVLVLSVHVAVLLGPWVLAIGLMRYVSVAASWVLPWLRGALPPRFSAKVVAAVQGIVLVAAASGVLPSLLAAVLVATALVLLTWSFGHDIVRLWRGLPA